MGRRCTNCDTSLATYNDIAVNGGSISGSSGSLYVSGTFPCPECGARLDYEAKMCMGYPEA